MFGKKIKLFNLFGFEVKIHLSWFIIAFLVTWSLAAGLFPSYYEGLSTSTYWIMGILGAVGLFASIIFHELWHSLVARRFGMPMHGITLFIFGGVAEMEDEPPSAKAEFYMAIAGPVTSIIVGVIFYVIYILGDIGGWPTAATGVFSYLGFINFILAGFNLLPAFPLDGGRVLRSALWKWKDNLSWATRIASRIGSGFGVVLIIFGIFGFVRGSFIGGIWWVLIGFFLRNASQTSYQRVLMRRALEGESIKRFMESDPVTAPPSISVDELVQNYIYKYHFKMFPVLEDEKLVGCVTTRKVKGIPQEEWNVRTVKEITEECSDDNTISPEADAMDALSTMNKTQNSRLMVTEDGQLVGIISLKDMLKFLSLKLDLEQQDIKQIKRIPTSSE
ncbi:CBS domain-containing protein [Candidatus Poribacteria bacterium]|nr:CBS domain-containing protein [Candidatus Poribacteria bacterium]